MRSQIGDINDGNDDDDDDLSDLEGVASTLKRRRLAREERLLASGLYSQFSGCEGPSQLLDPAKTMSLHLCSWFGQHLCVN